MRALALPLAVALACIPLLTGDPARAQDGTPPKPEWRHGMSLFGELKYPAGFKQFDYVNAQAPKGGSVRQSAFGTFDNLNLAVGLVKGNLAGGVDLIYDTLMASSLDEVSSEYGLIAEAVSYPADYSSATFRLRGEAKWHDGQPITVDDVIYSLDVLKKNNPQTRRLL